MIKKFFWVLQFILILAVGFIFSYGVTIIWDTGESVPNALMFVGAAVIYLSAVVWFAVRKIIKHFTTNGTPRVMGANVQRF